MRSDKGQIIKLKCQNFRIYLLVLVCGIWDNSRRQQPRQHSRCYDILFRHLPLFVGGLNWKGGKQIHYCQAQGQIPDTDHQRASK